MRRNEGLQETCQDESVDPQSQLWLGHKRPAYRDSVLHKQAGLNETLKHHHTQNVAGVAVVRRVGKLTPDPEFLHKCSTAGP